MICSTCADAANRRAPADQHCGNPKCMCGHRTDRYRPAPEPEDDEPALTVKLLTTWVPACENGRHYAHPGETCDEYEAYCEAARAWWDANVVKIPAAELMRMSEVPAALRGPNWPESLNGVDAITAMYDRMRALTEQATEVHPRATVRLVGEPFDLGPVLTVYEQHAAEADAHTAAVEAAIASVPAAPGDRTITFPRIDTTKD